MKKEYQVIRQGTIMDLSKNVTEYLNVGDGWELVGGVVKDTDNCYLQAMVRNVPDSFEEVCKIRGY